MTAKQARDHYELQVLMLELADESAVSLIQCSCLSRQFVGAHGGTWHDLATCDESDAGAIGKAVRYLELRGLIRRHPDNPDLVQFE